MSVGIEEFEVAVVGAGPGGLASGVTLGSYGVDTLVVERRVLRSAFPRGAGGGAGPPPAAVDAGEPVGVGLRTRGRAALVTRAAPACRGRGELEPLLEEHL